MVNPLLIMVVVLSLSGIARAVEDPLLTYEWRGGLSQYKEIDVTISQAGEAKVVAHRHDLPALEYRTSLSVEEVAAIRTLVRSTGFFSHPAVVSRPGATDVGETKIAVHIGNQRNTVTFGYSPSLNPLVHAIEKLIAQASALQAIESDGDIYTAIGAVIPLHAGTKALQAVKLKEPLMRYIHAHDDGQKVEWALEALAWITTPEEYSGFISMGMEEPAQRGKILRIIGTHPYCGNIPESHLAALCPVYLSFLRDAYPRLAELDRAEKESLLSFARLLGETRYAPAVPLFMERFESDDRAYVDASLAPLASIGFESVQALAPYLDSPDENRRIKAILLITVAVRGGPHGGYANPLPRHEFDSMSEMLVRSVVPRLRQMSEKDPSDMVKNNARAAVTEIVSQVEKEKTPARP